MTSCSRCGETIDDEASFCPYDGTAIDPLIGQVVAGDVVIASLLGAGGMGRVYRGHQRGIGRDVAVKVLRRELSGNRAVVERFTREAKLASQVRHPNVVEVYLRGTLDDGLPYIVMELLDGVSLRAALDSAGGAFDVTRAIAIVSQIADACGEVHTRGVVHRDLKPDNVVLVKRGDVEDYVKVLDFGIAKAVAGELATGTAAGAVFGTARYISPEGARGGSVSAASDVYSLATMLYEMLSGRAPFDGASGLSMLVKQVHESPPDLRDVAPERGIPDAVAELVMTNLAKDPARRAPNGRTFATLLRAAAAPPVSVPPPQAPATAHRARPPRASIVAGLMFLLGAATAGAVQIALPIRTAEAAPAACAARKATRHVYSAPKEDLREHDSAERPDAAP